MSIIIKYTTGQYQSKVTELEGYYNLLKTHLDRMSELKEHMYDFWEDENAQLTGMILSSQIRNVQTTMDHVYSTLTFYKSTIDKFDASDAASRELLEDALLIVDAIL